MVARFDQKLSVALAYSGREHVGIAHHDRICGFLYGIEIVFLDSMGTLNGNCLAEIFSSLD